MFLGGVINLKTFKTKYIQEQNLIFGGQHEEKDPRLGLKYFGPYHYPSETATLEKIRLGIIGNKSMLEKSKEIIEMIGRPIDNQERNKWLYPPFPGMSPDSRFNCSIELSECWEETILQSEIDNLKEIIDSNERIGAAVQLYIKKIENMLKEDNLPDVVLCCLPSKIEEYCGISERTRGAKTPRPTKLEKHVQELKEKNQTFLADWGVNLNLEEETKVKGYDFHNALKGKVMGLRSPVPTQLLRESTADAMLNYDESKKKVRQEPASFAWNFSTALFYKANGKPWRLAKLKQDTCYVGISFYRDKLTFNREIQTSMAQVFAHSGEGLVLRGTEVYVDEKSKEPHLSENQAKELLLDALNNYTEIAGRTPTRVVVHKSTLFTKPEQKGFSDAIGNIKRDFVTITKRTKGIRFMRMGSYPVLRGTLISLTEKEHILFTSGYISRIRTYPGHSIPQPLLIIHEGDSEIKEICNEILGLTKLNWNTTEFSTELPITLAFSTKVGQILSELDKNIPLQNHYRFYM